MIKLHYNMKCIYTISYTHLEIKKPQLSVLVRVRSKECFSSGVNANFADIQTQADPVILVPLNTL